MFPSDEGNSVEGVKRHTGSTPENSYQQGSEVGRRGLTVTHRQTHGRAAVLVVTWKQTLKLDTAGRPPTPHPGLDAGCTEGLHGGKYLICPSSDYKSLVRAGLCE